MFPTIGHGFGPGGKGCDFFLPLKRICKILKAANATQPKMNVLTRSIFTNMA